ncbi:MAG TPA: 50S ribosomal protein L9 [bacterium]|jgi:large subunit ribosomal protein L9|nr:50S ribosomal protein L9 [bacterium]HNT66574.1 50S ribosomal protein L9 [bacterium]HOX86382.1 50S ribosomal protein L9 [bacterium]HPG45789.1 50S ribosomal protein L9 [bacterium]HPM97984.1 50S ribosomal protein L9 [bacterium]
MKIILKKDIEKVGRAGEIVDVKPGFARNYLIPSGNAVLATKGNLKVYEMEQKRAEQRLSQEKVVSQALADKLAQVSVTATVQVGEEDKVFGAVTSQEIAGLLAEQGFDIDRRKIVLDEPLKALGVYDVPIKIHPEVTATIKVWVVRD